MTDSIVQVILLFYLIRGALKGFLRTLLGPISLISSMIISAAHYNQHHSYVQALLISVLGPFIIHMMLSFFIKTWNATINEKKQPSPLSRTAGGFFSLTWGATYITLVLILLAIIPSNFQWLNKIQHGVRASRSYALIKKITAEKIPIENFDVRNISAFMSNPQNAEKMESTKEFKDIFENEKFKNLLGNDELQQHIEDKNFGALLSNPKMQELLKDGDFVKKILSLQKRILQENLGSNNTTTTDPDIDTE